MNRYNIFNLIHKGLRASLYHTAMLLQQTDFTDKEEATAAIEAIEEIIFLFRGHAEKEDKYILPAIEEYEPAVVAAFEQEHEQDEILASRLNGSLAKLAIASNPLEESLSGRELNKTFVDFMIFNLQHMAKEEESINPILWRYYTDDEIKSISQNISKSVKPWIQDFYVKWMMRGINVPEATEWLQLVEATAPEVVFQTLIQKAKKEFATDKYKKLKNGLQELAVAV